MRCRGPRLASPHQVSQLPGLPGTNAPSARARKPALGSGCPAPPTSRSCPRAVPVSNGESISTASLRYRARPALNLFPAFSASTGCPQNIAGYPHSVMVFHRLLHRPSTGYQALPGGTLSCLHLLNLFLPAFPIRFPESTGARSEIIRWISAGPFQRVPYRIIAGWLTTCDDEDDQSGASSLA
jgi:hypothetical protein